MAPPLELEDPGEEFLVRELDWFPPNESEEDSAELVSSKPTVPTCLTISEKIEEDIEIQLNDVKTWYGIQESV